MKMFFMNHFFFIKIHLLYNYNTKAFKRTDNHYDFTLKTQAQGARQVRTRLGFYANIQPTNVFGFIRIETLLSAHLDCWLIKIINRKINSDPE